MTTLTAAPQALPKPSRTGQLARVPGHLAIVTDLAPTIDPAQAQLSVQSLRAVISGCLQRGIRCVSVFFPYESSDAARPDDLHLMALSAFVGSERDALAARGVRVAVLSDSADCKPGSPLLETVRRAAEIPVSGEVLRVNLGLDYSGRAELVSAVQSVAREVQAGRLAAEELTTQTLYSYLPQQALAPVDLLVRTGGDARLSDFLLWHSAYAELLFIDAAWPQFRQSQFDDALGDYARRQRTFGALPQR